MSRWKAFSTHLIINFAIAIIIAIIAFEFWYPYPLNRISAGTSIFKIIILVDVIIGPILTLLLWNRGKSKRALLVDVIIICSIQIFALFYGLKVLYLNRPIYIVFEIDRFRVISALDFYHHNNKNSNKNKIKPSIFGPKVIASRLPIGDREIKETFELSIMGIEPSMRPEMLDSYQAQKERILKKGRRVGEIYKKYPEKKIDVDSFLKSKKLMEEGVLWLPLVSRESSEWIMIFKKMDGEPVLYMNIDGFNIK